MTAFSPGDYISFQRIVHGKREVGHRIDHATGRAIVVPAIEEQILPQVGHGLVLKVNKHPKKIKNKGGHDIVNCGRVDAGPLGIVTAVLDDATLTGIQMALGDFGSFETRVAAAAMYGTDAKGGA